jgi:hypothetical protein
VSFNAISKPAGVHTTPQREYPILVVDGKEGVPAHLKATDSPFEWTGEWHDPDHPRAQLAAAGSCGSLRLKGTRTDCMRSIKEKHIDQIEAVFEFNCDENQAFDVTIEAEPFPFSYVRFLKRSQNNRRYCDCGEQAGVYHGTKAILDLRLPTEIVHLGIEDSRDTLWVRLDELPVIKDLIKKPKSGASGTVGHDQVAHAIVRSTRGEKFSGNAYNNAQVTSKIKPETKLTVTVN